MRYSNIEPDQEINAVPWVTGVGAAEPEPVAGREVSFGDREDTRQPRLRRQKIIAIWIQSGIGNEKSDREQLARTVEEKAKLHLHRDCAEVVLEDEQPGRIGCARLSRRLMIRAMRLDSGQGRPPPVQEIRSATIAPHERDSAGDVDHRRALGGEFR